MRRRIDDYPSEINGTVREQCGRAPCFKCGSDTPVGYRDGRGRVWATCYDCAIRAAKTCPVCGRQVETSTFDEIPQPNGERAKIRTALRHEDGSHCHPVEADARYALPCSSCGATMRVRVIIGLARYGSLGTSMGCACGARWELDRVRPGYHMYLAPVA